MCNRMAKDETIKPSVRAMLEALERDICDWLEENQSLQYENKREEIIEAISRLSFSPQMLLELATHMLIRMGQAHFVIQREKKLEPLVAIGYKNLGSRRRNAAKPRNGGKIEHLKAIKKILRKEKKNDVSFKNFLTNALNNTIQDLELKSISDSHYKVRAESSHDWIVASIGTIRGWYSASNKKI